MNKVQVLMSTYNGEKYIRQQLDSIMNQTYANVSILVRDDGSSDKTVEILREYESRYGGRISILLENNRGVVHSQFILLHHSDSSASYYCFCDQDDIWLPDKVARTVDQLKNIETAAMLFTSTQLVSQDLTKIKKWPQPPSRAPSFNNAIVENIAVGATIGFNHKARSLLIEKQVDPSQILMHDWWTYLCISAFGEVLYDPVPSILYRQHNTNLIGGNSTFLSLLKNKWKSFVKNKSQMRVYMQAMEFYKNYSMELEEAKRDELVQFIHPRTNLRSRINYMRKCKLYRQSRIENVFLRFVILFGYI